MKQRFGFTLVECALALMVTSMAVLLINFTIVNFNSVEKINYNDDIQWYIFMRELESNEHKFELKDCTSTKLIMISQVTHKLYRLECKDGHLYLTTDDGGYLPLMEHVNSYTLKKANESQVSITVKMHNNIERSGFVKLISTAEVISKK
ncbi:ComGF family competence protein [Paucilactobacillus suebicus]|uniref:Competence protein ComGF n=1 Tax=Paucilactobacillus suebicus DSM 5007 = KCTC 3549 TaxID=1423807 RepID=A0A0R1VU27_9LACO|nr:ComGF family competence protein [Paucilactobacillus suebicus]KRM09262.1 hypothetical protein FD16_GL001886 [Paucilactobacillus suebicus DSM 5007 = KCTC 3549]